MKQILLATYNGERFLAEQLESLLRQSDQDWTILARDDNSTDRTVEILNTFAARHPDKMTIVRDHPDGPNTNLGGPSQNFGRLLELSTAPYVMFCDQDDVWHPDKIAKSMQKMHELESTHGTDVPLLVHADHAITDANNGVIVPSNSQWQRLNAEQDTKLDHLMFRNVVSGFTMTLNRPLANEMLPIPNIMHDHWGALQAAAKGYIGFVDEPLADYRQHGNNVIGAPVAQEGDGIRDRIARKVKQGWAKSWEDMVAENSDYYRAKQRTAAALLGQAATMEDASRSAMVALLNLEERGYFSQRIALIRHHLIPSGSREQSIQRLLLPIDPLAGKNIPAEKLDIGDLIRKTPHPTGPLSAHTLAERAGGLTDLIIYNGEANALSAIEKSAAIMFTHSYQNAVAQKKIPENQRIIPAREAKPLVAIAMKKFVQNAHASTGHKSGYSQWDDITCGYTPITNVTQELLHKWIPAEIQDHIAAIAAAAGRGIRSR